MVKPRYIDSLCRPFCSFFTEGEKEGEACGGVVFIDREFSPAWCAQRGSEVGRAKTVGRGHDAVLKEKLCTSCPFAADDCDFRAGVDSPPCGGYVLMALLLDRNPAVFDNR